MNFSKKNKIEQRLAMLYSNIEAWVNNYHTLYQLGYDETIRVRQSDNSSCIKRHEIPNLTSYLNMSVKHGNNNPQMLVEGTLAELYVNTVDKSLWVCTRAGYDSWDELFTGELLSLHNVDPQAHKDFIARITGSPDVAFEVKTAKELGEYYDAITAYLYTAVNKAYTGDTDLARVFDVSISGSINTNYTVKGHPTIYNEGRFLVSNIDPNNYVTGDRFIQAPKNNVDFRCRGIFNSENNNPLSTVYSDDSQPLGGYKQGDRLRHIAVKPFDPSVLGITGDVTIEDAVILGFDAEDYQQVNIGNGILSDEKFEIECELGRKIIDGKYGQEDITGDVIIFTPDPTTWDNSNNFSVNAFVSSGSYSFIRIECELHNSNEGVYIFHELYTFNLPDWTYINKMLLKVTFNASTLTVAVSIDEGQNWLSQSSSCNHSFPVNWYGILGDCGERHYPLRGSYNLKKFKVTTNSITRYIATSDVIFNNFGANDTGSVLNPALSITVPAIQEGDLVEAEAIVTSVGLTGKVWVDGIEYSKGILGLFLTTDDTIHEIYMGRGLDAYWQSIIDLEGYKLEVDGELVYEAIKREASTLDSYTIVDLINGLKEKLNHIDNSLKLGNDNSITKGNIEQGNLSIIDTSVSDLQQNVAVGTYYVPVSTGDIIEIELVGAGGGLADRNGGIDEYNDTQPNWQYYHSGGGGAYFKGRFTAWADGTLKLITPENGGIENTKGGDAIAIFIDANNNELELARASGGAYGAPPVSSGFLSNVAGGRVTYNSLLVTAITSINGTVGSIYSSFHI